MRVETDQVLIEGLQGPFAARHRGWSTGLVLGLDYNALQWKVIALSPTTRVFIFDHHDPYGELPPHFGYGSSLVRLGVHAEARF